MKNDLIFKKTIVVGAGAMGIGIAQVLSQAGATVFLYDIDLAGVKKALEKLEKVMERLVVKGRLERLESREILKRITPIEALEKAESARAELEAAADEEYKAIAAEVKADTGKKVDYTFKRQGEEIFRRDMGEPEFWLEKEDRFPRPILSSDEQESITRQAETPQDQTPAYNPQHVLSPEFGGVSNYERGVDSFLDELKAKLAKQKSDPESTEKEILATENEITYLESIHENFYIGMNVFRTAKGGRNKISA